MATEIIEYESIVYTFLTCSNPEPRSLTSKFLFYCRVENLFLFSFVGSLVQ